MTSADRKFPDTPFSFERKDGDSDIIKYIKREGNQPQFLKPNEFLSDSADDPDTPSPDDFSAVIYLMWMLLIHWIGWRTMNSCLADAADSVGFVDQMLAMSDYMKKEFLPSRGLVEFDEDVFARLEAVDTSEPTE